MTDTRSVDSLLQSYPEGVRQLAEDARRCIREWLPDVIERADTSARLISYGHGPGYKGGVCTLILSKAGIKLGLVGGATLPDPYRLLAGSGTVHRHVQLLKSEDLTRPGLKQLVLEASAACEIRLGPERRVGR